MTGAFVIQPKLAKCCTAFVRCFWPLLFSRSASRLELAVLNKYMPAMRLPEEIIDYYMKDMPNFRKETMCPSTGLIWETTNLVLQDQTCDSAGDVLVRIEGDEMCKQFRICPF